MTKQEEIKIIKYELFATPIFMGSHSAICPVCGVGSNLYPCYGEGNTTTVPHRLTYCNHLLESEEKVLLLGRGEDVNDDG